MARADRRVSETTVFEWCDTHFEEIIDALATRRAPELHAKRAAPKDGPQRDARRNAD